MPAFSREEFLIPKEKNGNGYMKQLKKQFECNKPIKNERNYANRQKQIERTIQKKFCFDEFLRLRSIYDYDEERLLWFKKFVENFHKLGRAVYR